MKLWGTLAALAMILAWIVTVAPTSPLVSLFKREKRAFDAARRARAMARLVGPTRAAEQVLAENQKQIDALDAAEKARARELLDSPTKLARYLVRVGEKVKGP